MPLIVCPECGTLVSTAAVRCPGCRLPPPAEEPRPRAPAPLCAKCGNPLNAPGALCPNCAAAEIAVTPAAQAVSDSQRHLPGSVALPVGDEAAALAGDASLLTETIEAKPPAGGLAAVGSLFLTQDAPAGEPSDTGAGAIAASPGSASAEIAFDGHGRADAHSAIRHRAPMWRFGKVLWFAVICAIPIAGAIGAVLNWSAIARRAALRFQQRADSCRARKQYDDAVWWWREAARLGDAQAMYSLGAAYANGIGVARAPVAAVHWYRAAAERGNTAAMVELARMERAGLG